MSNKEKQIKAIDNASASNVLVGMIMVASSGVHEALNLADELGLPKEKEILESVMAVVANAGISLTLLSNERIIEMETVLKETVESKETIQ